MRNLASRASQRVESAGCPMVACKKAKRCDIAANGGAYITAILACCFSMERLTRELEGHPPSIVDWRLIWIPEAQRGYL